LVCANMFFIGQFRFKNTSALVEMAAAGKLPLIKGICVKEFLEGIVAILLASPTFGIVNE